MRILHAIHTPRFSGAEILVSSLTTAHSRMGHTSSVVSFNPPETNFLPLIDSQAKIGIKWHQPVERLNGLKRTVFYRRIMKETQPDVVFAHSVIPAAYARMAGSWPVITVLHSENDYPSGKIRLSEYILQYRSAGVISVSEISHKSYTNSFSQPKAIFIPNGIDVRSIQNALQNRLNLRVALGIHPDTLLLLQVGRISRIKRQHLTLTALESLVCKSPRYHLLFAGIVEDIEYQHELEDYVAKKELSNHVTFLGPRLDVADLLAAADVFVMPSSREAQGLALLEALASGLPVVASDISGFQFAREYSGVSLINPENINTFTAAIIEATPFSNYRLNRPANEFDIQTTATRYIEFAKECIF